MIMMRTTIMMMMMVVMMKPHHGAKLSWNNKTWVLQNDKTLWVLRLQ